MAIDGRDVLTANLRTLDCSVPFAIKVQPEEEEDVAGALRVRQDDNGGGLPAIMSLLNGIDADGAGLGIAFYARDNTGAMFNAGNCGFEIVDRTATAVLVDFEIQIWYHDDFFERFRITSAGNVGIGTTTPGSMLHVTGGVQVGSPTGGDQGSGTINVSGDIYKNGTAYTNPDYVFERYFEGSTISDYPGHVPLDSLETTLRAERRLPGIGGEARGIFSRQDILLEKLEEAYLYIVELSRRVQRLETLIPDASANSRG